MPYTSLKFEDYIGTLSTNIDYANYVTGKLVFEGRNGQLSDSVGIADIIEIEDAVIELISKVQKLRGKRQ